LFYYNQIASLNTELAKANGKIKTLAALQSGRADGVDGRKLKDGTYSGQAQGYGGLVTMKISVSDNAITAAELVSAPHEDPPYLSSCLPLLNQIVAGQSTAIDTVSGATYTSNGIIGSVNAALDKAAR
jgi:uncharacterized protein with FMN-binding domain